MNNRTSKLLPALLACILMAIVFGALAVLPGCLNPAHNKAGADSASDLNAKGVAAKDPKIAKGFFQRAIAADAYFGPAYNNMGIVYLDEENYFEAARCFDQAVHLMPNDPAPRIHLGIVYENAGQFQNALEQFSQALVLSPGSMDALEAVTRVQVRLENVDDKTVEHLRIIASRGSDATWQSWATRVLIRLGDAGPPPSSAPTTQK